MRSDAFIHTKRARPARGGQQHPRTGERSWTDASQDRMRGCSPERKKSIDTGWTLISMSRSAEAFHRRSHFRQDSAVSCVACLGVLPATLVSFLGTCLSQVKVDEVLRLVCHVGPKVAAHDAVPGCVVLFIKLLLNEGRDVLWASEGHGGREDDAGNPTHDTPI